MSNTLQKARAQAGVTPHEKTLGRSQVFSSPSGGLAQSDRSGGALYLLDVNVLIALVDPGHVQHEEAHAWFEHTGQHGFATCPLTENGLVRILGHAKYPNSPGSPGAVVASLAAIRALPGHRFWADDISLADGELIDTMRLLSHTQVTDTYLLALAQAHGGQLASLDRKLLADAVVGGKQALALIA
jgi:uncharacterized protein